MNISRLATLKAAKDHLAHGLRHNPHDLEERAKAVLDLLLDINERDPLPASNKQYLPEMFFAQEAARFVIDKLPLYLHRQGRLEEVYRSIKDPTALSGCIAWGLTSRDDSDTNTVLREILKTSLELGGVLPASFTLGRDILNHPRQARGEFNFPPLDQVKLLVTNQLKNEWAIEPNAHNVYRYGQFIAFLVSYISDHDPQWAMEFIQENEQHLSELFEGNFYGLQSTDARVIGGCLHSSQTAGLLIELNRVKPEQYDELMGNHYMMVLLLDMVEKAPDFKVADLPANEGISKGLLVAMFIRCASTNSLTQERLDDLQSVWARVEPASNLVREALKNRHFKEVSTEMAAYNDLIRSEKTTAKDLVSNKNFDMVGQNWLLVDSLSKKKGSRITDDPKAYASHMAFLMGSTDVEPEFFKDVPVTAITIGVGLQILGEWTDDSVRAFVQSAFDNKEHHPEVAKITMDDLEVARRELALDEKVIRKINWVDRSIKATLLEQDLGM